MKEVLPYIPRGPAFRDVMDEQDKWMVTHPGGNKGPLIEHLKLEFSDYTVPPKGKASTKAKKPKKKDNKAKNPEAKKNPPEEDKA